MKKEELAEMLDGRQIGDEITPAEAKQAAKDGLVVVYGASDDLMEFAGAIEEEFGTDADIDKDGNIIEICDDECIHYQKALKGANHFEAHFPSHGDEGWTFETNIPHAIFKIYEDGDLYCNGIVFEIKDLK